jgi:hypothetical protein
MNDTDEFGLLQRQDATVAALKFDPTINIQHSTFKI